jgi:hypothetical protein
MTLAQAETLIQALLLRDADCRCGNFALSDEEREAMKTLILHAGGKR